MFDSHRDESSHRAEKLKCSASEMLGLYGLFRHYVETKTHDDDPGIAAARASFMKCCALVDMILDMKNAVTPLRASVPALRQRVAEFFAAHETAYGWNSMKPKHHWIWDFIMNWLDDPMILDAMVIERLHLRIKRVAEQIENTRPRVLQLRIKA